MKFSTRVMLAAALLCASNSWAAHTEVQDTVVTLKRGSSNVLPAPLTYAECMDRKAQLIAQEGASRETGASVYQCLVAYRSMVTFRPNPPPVCPEKPADAQRSQTCPAGTVGTWMQDWIWTLQPYPTCWVQGEWTPAEPPAGMCAPADSDGDGVPDPADECPTVYAQTPNGCPATPPAQLPAPGNVRAQGISTSQIRVTWEAVTGAGAYSLERCIGASCTTFSQLSCVSGTAGTHSGLPANLTARYRVRASREAGCGTAAGNLGEYSAIVSGTTLGTAPASGSASLSWTPPTQNTDGSALTNLAGFRISYGTSATALTQTIQISNPGLSSYTISRLPPGTYYFSIRAYTSVGTESVNSNVVSKVIL